MCIIQFWTGRKSRKNKWHNENMWRIKRIFVFEHSVMTNFNCACSAIQRDLAFCLKVPLDSLLVLASSGGSGETAQMRRFAWTFAARIGDKYQIRLTRPICLTFYQRYMFIAPFQQVSETVKPTVKVLIDCTYKCCATDKNDLRIQNNFYLCPAFLQQLTIYLNLVTGPLTEFPETRWGWCLDRQQKMSSCPKTDSEIKQTWTNLATVISVTAQQNQLNKFFCLLFGFYGLSRLFHPF